MGGPTIRVAIIGTGGFAGEHHRVVHELERDGRCRLVAACDPAMEAFVERCEALEFDRRGVDCFNDYREMIASSRPDLVTVPTPVPLHAPMHRVVVQSGAACYLEKPPTLFGPELEEMIAVDVGAARRTQVGFNFIIEEERQALKRRILDGEFGTVRRVSFLGLWPRSTAYFRRSPWAGRLWMDGKPILDSCIGNAMAHYLHNVLFWAGRGELFSWAAVLSVRAELYRAHPIEGTDTVFAEAHCEGGVQVLVAATHACIGAHRHREVVECEKATITYTVPSRVYIESADGSRETIPLPQADLLKSNIEEYLNYLDRQRERPITRLEDCRPFVRFNNLMYLAAGRISTVPERFVRRMEEEGGRGILSAIDGVEEACERALATGQFPGERGVEWGRPAGVADMDRLPALVEAIESMRDER